MASSSSEEAVICQMPIRQTMRFTDVSRIRRFPFGHFPGQTFAGKTLPGYSFSQIDVSWMRHFRYSDFPRMHAQVIKNDSKLRTVHLYLWIWYIWWVLIYIKYLPFKPYFVKVLLIILSVGLVRWRWRVDWLKSAHLHGLSAASVQQYTTVTHLSVDV